MIRDRGFVIPPYEENLLNPNYPLPDFVQIYTNHATQHQVSFREALTNNYQVSDGTSGTYVRYAPVEGSKTLSTSFVSVFIEQVKESKLSAILVTDIDLSSDAQKHLMEYPHLHIQVFLDAQLLYNVTEHCYYQPHERLSKEDKAVFLTNARTKSTKINAISIDDPVVRHFDFRVGDIIRIHRTNLGPPMIANKSIAYRMVDDVPVADPAINVWKKK